MMLTSINQGSSKNGNMPIEQFYQRLHRARTGEAKPLIMGILNLTDDSFSDDGLLKQGKEDWVTRCLQLADGMLKQGADILDMGAQSTRPGHKVVGATQELDILMQVLPNLRVAFPDALISIDSYHASVVESCLQAGANIINDIKGGADEAMLLQAKTHQCPIILMHNKVDDHKNIENQAGITSYTGTEETDFICSLKARLQAICQCALAHDIEAKQIILDPGIGFGLLVEQNLAIIRELSSLNEIGYPLLIGASRKSFIGRLLNLPQAQDRDIASSTLQAIAAKNGAAIIRTHNVKAAYESLHIQHEVYRLVD